MRVDVGRAVEAQEEAREEVGHAVEDVRARLAVREAVVEAPELLAVLEDGAHHARVLEVAEVLLAQARLGGELDALARERLEDREQRLARAQVRRVVEAHALVAHELPQLQAARGALSEAALGERDERVGRRLVPEREREGA